MQIDWSLWSHFCRLKVFPSRYLASGCKCFLMDEAKDWVNQGDMLIEYAYSGEFPDVVLFLYFNILSWAVNRRHLPHPKRFLPLSLSHHPIRPIRPLHNPPPPPVANPARLRIPPLSFNLPSPATRHNVQSRSRPSSRNTFSTPSTSFWILRARMNTSQYMAARQRDGE